MVNDIIDTTCYIIQINARSKHKTGTKYKRMPIFYVTMKGQIRDILLL